MRNFITVKDLMDNMRIGRNKAYGLCALRGFPAIKIGKTYRIDEQKFEKWIEENIGSKINL